jgi:tripartite-type tricarboxylate transporter receptor subunit TctC
VVTPEKGKISTAMSTNRREGHMLSRRRFVTAAAGASIAAHLTPFAKPAIAQTIAKPARLIVGFPAGGAPDLVARLIAEHMKGYAQSLIVDNRPGAGGRIALEALKGSDADGSVMVLTPVDQLALFPHIYKRLSYKPLEDLAPVTIVCSVQFLLTVGPRVPVSVHSLADFIGWCRDNPQAAAYGTAGAGTHPHFLGVTLARAAGFEFVHVPYKGGASAVQDMLGGHLAACISTIGTLLSNVQSGTLRALATTAPRRSVALPDVSTFREAGYPLLESVSQFGMLVPARTPADAVAALHKAIRGALETDAVRAGLAKLSLEPADASPSEFTRLIASDTQRWAEVVKDSGFKPID